MVINKILKFIGFALLLIAPAGAQAWSSAGHKIIAQIANQQLTPQVRQQISTLTGEDLEASAWWPDQIKDSTAWKHTASYHFKELNEGVDYFTSLKTLSESSKKRGDIIRALLKAEDVLRDTKASLKDQKNALRFLTHFVADIHQPLHAGFVSDLGGNKVSMTWFGKSRNLHSVWDGSLISTHAFKNNIQGEQYISEYAALLDKPTPQQMAQWQNSYVMEWFEESLEQRGEAYIGLSETSENYYQRHIDRNNLRLVQAGYRLGHWLNQIFTKAPLSAKAQTLRKDILNTLGSSTKYEILLSEKSTRFLADDTAESEYDRHIHCQH